jgi:hypothetical protein
MEPVATTSVTNEATSSLAFIFSGDLASLPDILGGNGLVIRKIDECSPGVIDLDSRESGDPPMLTLVVQ